MDLATTFQSRLLSPSKTFLGKVDWKMISLLGLPFLLIIINDGWLLSHVLLNFIDTWIYLGYFLDLEQHLNVFPKAYFGTRLPWILPGYLANHLFSPWFAMHLLHLVFYCTAISSLYLILKQLLGRHAAFLTAILMGCHSFFLVAIGTDYIDGAAMTYFLLTLLMLTNLAESQYPRFRLCCAGIFYGCLIYTQLFLIAYTPLIILYYFFFNRVRISHVRSLLFVAAGFIGLTLVFCAVTYHLNGRFWFFKHLIKWTTNFVAHENPWWAPISSWWSTAIWLLFPAITFFGSVVILISHRITRSLPNRKAILFFQVYFILTVLLHVFLEMFMNQHVLRFSYYASYLMPAMFLAIGSQLAIVTHALSRRRFYLLLGFVVLIALLPYIPFVSQKLNFSPVWLTISIGIAGIACIILQGRFKEIGVFLIALSIGTINLSQTRAWPSTDNTALRKNSYLSVVKSVAAIQSMDPESKSRFWYNLDDPLGSLYRSVASTYLWAYRLISEEFPNLYGKEFSAYHVTLNDRIFILSNDNNAVEKANQSLAKVGFKGEFLDERHVQQGDISYKITYFKVCSLKEALSPPALLREMNEGKE